jgi:hypothetical protein
MECEFCRKMIFCLLHGDRYIDVINTEGYPLYYCVKCLIKNFKDKTPAPYITAVVHDHLDMVILMKAAKKAYTYEILKQEFPKLFEPIKSISEEEFERQQELLHKHR